jgi:hypothetical protein
LNYVESLRTKVLESSFVNQICLQSKSSIKIQRVLIKNVMGEGMYVFAVMKRWCYTMFGWFCGGEGVVVAMVVSVVFRWFCDGDMVVKDGFFVWMLWW